MLVKLLGGFLGIAGLLLVVFSLMVWRELNEVATSQASPAVDALPLTSLVCPELLNAGKGAGPATKPVVLVQMAFRRIYLMAGVGFGLSVIGGVLLVVTGGTSRDD